MIKEGGTFFFHNLRLVLSIFAQECQILCLTLRSFHKNSTKSQGRVSEKKVTIWNSYLLAETKSPCISRPLIEMSMDSMRVLVSVNSMKEVYMDCTTVLLSVDSLLEQNVHGFSIPWVLVSVVSFHDRRVHYMDCMRVLESVDSLHKRSVHGLNQSSDKDHFFSCIFKDDSWIVGFTAKNVGGHHHRQTV